MSALPVVPLSRNDLARVAPNYEAMRTAIACCEKVDEIANLADQAVAAQAYFRQSQDVENEMQASRIYLLAERKLGALLKERAARVQEWISAARQSFTPTRRQSCRICGRFKSLTHAHHLVPLTIQASRNYITPDQSFAWLCPTHHAAVHVMIAQRRHSDSNVFPSAMSLLGDLETEELKLVMELASAADEKPSASIWAPGFIGRWQQVLSDDSESPQGAPHD